MPRLWELAALGLLLVIVGVVAASPDVTVELRVGSLVALAAAALLVGRLPRRGGD